MDANDLSNALDAQISEWMHGYVLVGFMPIENEDGEIEAKRVLIVRGDKSSPGLNEALRPVVLVASAWAQGHDLSVRPPSS